MTAASAWLGCPTAGRGGGCFLRSLLILFAVAVAMLAVCMQRGGYSISKLPYMIESVVYEGFVALDTRIREVSGGEDRQRFFNKDNFPLVQDFENHIGEMQAELEYVMKHIPTPQFDKVVPGQGPLNRDQKWTVFQFRVYNRDLEFNHKLCPVTSALVKKYTDISYAMFSILHGPKYIPPHKGLYSGVLRVHIPLKVPNECSNTAPSQSSSPPPSSVGECYIRVKNETRIWEEGKALVLDDSLEHEVYLNVKAQRVVLFLDIRRPLPILEDLCNRLFLWYSRYIGVVGFVVEEAKRYTMAATEIDQNR
mmetsp:Transcript_3826/g.6014  ORF Transcript_3826/g.6014 Transcript_3826/m.6014 type:complete len:308 (-) Transcript_3826:275-1198(-)